MPEIGYLSSKSKAILDAVHITRRPIAGFDRLRDARRAGRE
jgi:hypothetical protein